MEKLFLLVVTFATCFADSKDLSGKVFVFPRESSIDHVKLVTHKTTLSSVTTCLRFQTDVTRNYGLFSLATPTNSNGFVLFKINTVDTIRMHARDGGADFLSLSLAPNTWHSMCATWRSDNGLAQLWVDGKAGIKKFIQTGPINGTPITILGQEQDSYGGGFDTNQSFIGMITEVHMWDHVVTAADIKRYMEGKHFTPGNVINWKSLEYVIHGQVLVEEESEVM